MKDKGMGKSALISTFAASVLLTSPLVLAEEIVDTEVLAPPSLETGVDNTVIYETRTVYESQFLPGVRLCEDSEVDYRGDFRRVNCQDTEILEALSTRDPRVTLDDPNKVFKNDFHGSGNILRINFQRKVVTNP